jgi:hypothetical protein
MFAWAQARGSSARARPASTIAADRKQTRAIVRPKWLRMARSLQAKENRFLDLSLNDKSL